MKKNQEILVKVAQEVISTTIKAVSVHGATLTVTVSDKFHSQVRDWDETNQKEILHEKVVESSVLFNVFNLYLTKVESDREYLISKTFAEMRRFFEKTGQVAEMPPFMEALLLGTKVMVAHNLVEVKGSEIPKLKTFMVIEGTEKPIPQMMLEDIKSWKPALWTKSASDKE